MTAERSFAGCSSANASAAFVKRSQFLLQEPPRDGQANLYYWYYATLTLFQVQGHDWEAGMRPCSNNCFVPANRACAGRELGHRHRLGWLWRSRLHHGRRGDVPGSLLPPSAAVRVGRRRRMSHLPAGEPQAMNRISSRTACPAWSAVNGVCSSFAPAFPSRRRHTEQAAHADSSTWQLSRRAASSRNRSELGPRAPFQPCSLWHFCKSLPGNRLQLSVRVPSGSLFVLRLSARVNSSLCLFIPLRSGPASSRPAGQESSGLALPNPCPAASR